MKKIKYLLFSMLLMVIGLTTVDAASLKVSANKSTVVVGSTVTITVNANGASGWEYCLSYDDSLFTRTKSTADTGGDCVKTGSTLIGYSKVTFTLKAIKSGSGTIGLRSAQMYDDGGNAVKPTTNSISLTAKTQAEIEASYSTNADLSNIVIEGYELTPTFDKNVTEYELTVPNDVEMVNIQASKADNTASVKGAGETTLSEGSNKIEIVVTAQKGNTKTYILNITRQELNPIYVTVDGKQYSVVRKADNLELPSYYSSTTIMIGDDEVPAFESEITGFTLVGLKDEEGNISLYIYNTDGSYKKYEQFTTEGVTFIVLETDEILKGFESVNVTINDQEVKAYKMTISDADFVIVYGMNAKTGEKGWYQYDLREGSFQRYQTSVIISLQDDVKEYFLMVIVFAIGLGLSIIMIICLMILNSKKKRKLVKLLAVMENGQVVNKEYVIEEVEEPKKVDTKEVVDNLDMIHKDTTKVEPDEEKVSITLEINDLPISDDEEDDEEIEIEDTQEIEEVVMLDDEDVGCRFEETSPIEVQEEQLSKRELRRLEKEKAKEEKKRIAKAQREFLNDDLTSTSIFDTYVPEEEIEEAPKRRGRPRKTK